MNSTELQYIGKMALPIMVVKKDLLFPEGEIIGFLPHSEYDLHNKILQSYEFIIRGDAEQDLSYKQPICHIAIVNTPRKEVFAFQRASKFVDVTEMRLHGKWALGVGGHVDQGDDSNENPLQAALERELAEEVTIIGGQESLLYGYINNNSVEVDRYHLGVLYIIEAESAHHHESSSVQSSMLPFVDIEKLCEKDPNSFEYWSIIMLEPLQSYFERK